MQNTTGDPPYPWHDPQTAPDVTSPYVTVPNTNPYTPSTTPAIWPMPTPDPEPPIPGTEEFHDFMCWLAGFTDPDTPPSQERWEAFQQKVREMAVLFWEYKKEQRAREFNQPFDITLTTTAGSAGNATVSLGATGAAIGGGLLGDKPYTYEELSTM